MQLDDVPTTLAIVDGRVAMNADGDATVYVETPDSQPLAPEQTHLTLRVSGLDYRAAIELDGNQLHDLRAALTELDR